MSERVPGVEDIRQALRGDGWTLDEADEGIDRIKRHGIGIGQEMARETMQASIGDAVRKLQADAWDEGRASTGIMLPTLPPKPPRNPYREEQSDG